jgi:predicted nucleotide-binding protein (sugar kinase/HSP70/actin superfamily)
MARYEENRREYIRNNESIISENQTKKIKIALLGHSYILEDYYLNMNLKSKLQSMGIVIITPEMMRSAELRSLGDKLPKKIFWDYGSRAVGFAREMISDKVNGFLYISSFGCGIDSFVGDIIAREVKNANIPFSSINIDEHSGEAGLDTRLEAFIDMITRKRGKDNESDLSTLRKCIYNSEGSA